MFFYENTVFRHVATTNARLFVDSAQKKASVNQKHVYVLSVLQYTSFVINAQKIFTVFVQNYLTKVKK